MPAESPAQKHLACVALAYKRHGDSAIKDFKNKAAVHEMAKMSEKQLEDFCKSPVKG